jgi:cytochrome c553
MVLYKKIQINFSHAIKTTLFIPLLFLPLQLQAASILQGDIEKGQSLATAQCDRCHGGNGVSEDVDTPSLASQNSVYLFKQIRDYKSRKREDKNMFKRARKLNNQQMIDVSIWYESQQLPAFDLAQIKVTIETPQLVLYGDTRRRIPPCGTCHGGKYGKNKAIGINPKLAGKSADYLIFTLDNFKTGLRSNDPGGIMRSIAKKLTEDEISMLANYYALVGGGPVESED